MAAAAEVKGIVGYIAVQQVANIELEPRWCGHFRCLTRAWELRSQGFVFRGVRVKSPTSYLSGLCHANFDLKTDTNTGLHVRSSTPR